MKQPICFFTIASTSYRTYANKMINSFRKFYPDTPMIFFGQEDIDKAEKRGYSIYQLAPYFGSKLSKRYKIVVSIQADNIVCDKLPEIFKGYYEVAGGLNNYKGKLGIKLPEVSKYKYLNTGIIAAKSERFWELWRKLVVSHLDRYQFLEQDVVNNMLEFNDFKVKILDKTRFFYSSSLRQVWDKMEMRGDKIYCAGRLVKVIHWAGGEKGIKFNWHERKFDPEVCKRLDYLTSDEK